MRNAILMLLMLLSAAGCQLRQQFDAPFDVRSQALEFAKRYAEADTEYAWGGQDRLRVLRIDCSGLVVMCYKYALVDTVYELLFDDATARDMHDYYSREILIPRAGDLVFMGSADEPGITHIALFNEKIDGIIYFIDSTKKDAEGDYPAVNGVSERHYPEDDPRIKSFGRLQLRRSR